MKKASNKDSKAALVFGFDDIQNKNQINNSVTEDVSDGQQTKDTFVESENTKQDSEKSVEPREKVDIIKTDLDAISILISKNVRINDYSKKWDSIIKNGIDFFLTNTKNK